MDAANQKAVVSVPAVSIKSSQEQLNDLFGSYKAEWLKERLFEFFTAPDYLPDLTTVRPCVLMGGRGTGKTTVLRGLSYEGQLALKGNDKTQIAQFSYYGIYYRVNTNRVTAFKGPELTEGEWVKLFAHYINLIFCDAALRFLFWYQLHCDSTVTLSVDICAEIASSLHLGAVAGVSELTSKLRRTQIEFEAYINNVGGAAKPQLSLQGAPLDLLFAALIDLPAFTGKHFFFLVDEYENFEDYQQQLLNTLIKHSGQLYTFKIGVKELGWRKRSTLNTNEQLVDPADYAKINISERLQGGVFDKFALQVCQMRISKLEGYEISDIKLALPGYTEEEEADALGIAGQLSKNIPMHSSGLTNGEKQSLQTIPSLMTYFLLAWAESQGLKFDAVLRDYLANPKGWEYRYGNYKYSLLFSIRSGKSGLRKFYSGWDTFTQLAASNIRYLLELVDQSLLLHLRKGHDLSTVVTQEVQTLAAQSVGKKNLAELEGLSVHGAQLTKLLLGLGRVFQVMAAHPIGHTPELNQFYMEECGEGTPEEEVDELIRSAVMHLALLRSPGNKATDEAQTRAYDYMIHPIYAAFFEFSHRRKRKMLLTGNEVMGLVRDPHTYIKAILAKHHRSDDEELPEQAKLFEGYYGHD